MKKTLLVVLLLLSGLIINAQSKEEEKVAEVVQRFTKALEESDKTSLESLVSDKLSYGHSAGFVEDKTLFVNNLATGKSDFSNIKITNQTIVIENKNAIVRHQLDALTNDNGKPGEAHLYVLMVWQKKGGQWKLLARQGVKQPIVSQ